MPPLLVPPALTEPPLLVGAFPARCLTPPPPEKIYNQLSYQGAGQLTISSSTLSDFKLLAQTCSWRAASTSPWTACSNTGRTSCRSRHPQSKFCLLWNNWTISHISLPNLAFSHNLGTLELEYRYWAHLYIFDSVALNFLLQVMIIVLLWYS